MHEQRVHRGHSFTANPIACAATNASLDLFASERTYESWAKIERIHREELAKIEHAIDPRVCGTVAAFDIAGDTSYLTTQCAAIAHKARERGLFIRPLGNTLYLMPPYCATEDDLRGAWDVLRNLSNPEMEHDEHIMRQERRRLI